MSLVSATLILVALPESLPPSSRRTEPIRPADLNPLVPIGYLARRSAVGTLLMVSLLFNLAFEGIQSAGGVFIIQKFQIEPWQIGGLFAAAGIATALMQALLTGRLVARFGERAMTRVSLTAYVAGGLLIFFAPVFWLLYPVIFLQTAFGGFIFSTLATLMARNVARHEQGEIAGVDGALAGLAAMLGPIWAGLAYDHVQPGSPFWIGSIIFAIALLLFGARQTKAVAVPAS
jgi:DHA1 family tetracycline resistance protein-like MFS transporter